MPSLRKSCLFLFASLFLGLAFFVNQRVMAETVIDTTPFASTTAIVLGSSNIGAIGEPFTAPTIDSALQSFTFRISSSDENPHSVKFYVFAWGSNKTQGPALFQSDAVLVPGGSGYHDVTVNTGVLQLVPDNQYIIIVSNSGLLDKGVMTVQTTEGNFTGSTGHIALFALDSGPSDWANGSVGAFSGPHLAFKAVFISIQQVMNNLQNQIDTLTTANQTLQNQVNDLTGTVNTLKGQVTNLTNQNEQLSQANQTLQGQLTSANQTISSLSNQLTQLQAQLAQQAASIDTLVNSVEADFRRTFKDPGFKIQGATPQQRLQNLINAILNLNNGHKEGIYKSLDGKR